MTAPLLPGLLKAREIALGNTVDGRPNLVSVIERLDSAIAEARQSETGGESAEPIGEQIVYQNANAVAQAFLDEFPTLFDVTDIKTHGKLLIAANRAIAALRHSPSPGVSALARLKGKCEVTGQQESCDFCNMQIERVALETRDRIAFLEARRDELQANNLTLYHELRKERDRADARQNERDSFIPHTIVKNELGMTECVFEDVACVAKPLHPGVHHFIDELRAMDDDRLVGIQFWASRPSPGVSAATDKAARAAVERLKSYGPVTDQDIERLAEAFVAAGESEYASPGVSAPARVGGEAVDALGRPRNLSGITLAHEFASFVAGEGGDDEEEERDFGRFCQKHYAEILAALRSSAGTFEEGVEAAAKIAQRERHNRTLNNQYAVAMSFTIEDAIRALSQKDAPK